MQAKDLIKRDFILGGLNCAHCAEVIREKISKLDEVESCNINFISKKLTVIIYNKVNEENIISLIIDIINSIEPGLDISLVSKNNSKNNKKELILDGLNCAHCAEVIEKKVSKLEGIEKSNLNFINKKLSVEINGLLNQNMIIENIIDIINETEPGLDIKVMSNINSSKIHENDDNKKNKKDLYKLILGTMVYIFGIIQIAIGFESIMADILFIIAYIVVGGDVLLKALKNIIRGQMFDENFLMSIATIGALAIGEFPEAVGVMLFYKIGEYLQAMAVGKSRKSISALMQIKPDSANLKIKSKIKVVSPEEIKVGDTIVIKPGEKVPLDGVVIEGSSMLDTSALTGESVLRDTTVGDEILSGFINKNAVLMVKVSKEFGDSTVAKILDLVENAISKKSKTENFITKFSKYYTPIVVILAMAISVIPPILIHDAVFSDWLYRGLIFLVVSCPCALVLSIPLSFFSGIGFASKNGVLIKGSNYLEVLKNVDTIVLDKTGTLTKGVFNVTKLSSIGITDEELLKYAAIAEVNSNHPIARSIMSYYNKDIDINKINKYEEIASHGIKVDYENDLILAGNDKLMKSNNISYTKADDLGTIIYIAVNNIYKGYLVISDEIKEDSIEAIRQLKAVGIKQIVMLTGDNDKVANAIANKLGIDTVFANLLPHEKVEKLEALYIGKNNKDKIAFVGDGINDAPVLARADVGIAMGGLGSDAAIEAADVVLMTDEPSKISRAIKISRKTNIIVWQNIVFALGVKAIVLLLGAGGVATMWEAIFADVGVALIAVLNAMRVMR